MGQTLHLTGLPKLCALVATCFCKHVGGYVWRFLGNCGRANLRSVVPVGLGQLSAVAKLDRFLGSFADDALHQIPGATTDDESDHFLPPVLFFGAVLSICQLAVPAR